jgi:hypothetical protein
MADLRLGASCPLTVNYLGEPIYRLRRDRPVVGLLIPTPRYLFQMMDEIMPPGKR